MIALSRTTVTVPVGLVAVAAAGLAVGVATSWAQGVLPGSWNLLADSGAVWTVVAFALAAAYVPGRVVAVADGTLALVGEVLGYYRIAQPLRSIATTPSEQVLWTAAALVIGPLIGLAAHGIRRGSATVRVVSLLSVCGVAVGEGLFMLSRVSGDVVVAWLETGVAASVALIALASSPAPVRGRVLAVFAAAAVSTVVFVAYSEPTLLL